VNAFCQHQIRFLDIEEVVRRTLDAAGICEDMTLESVLEADRAAREAALEIVGLLER